VPAHELAQTKRKAVHPQVAFGLVRQVCGGTELGSPDCPCCGGELDLSQPGMDDWDELIGRCCDCRRLALVLPLAGSLRWFALKLPSREEAISEALAMLRRN
jgi:hypothetical protein